METSSAWPLPSGIASPLTRTPRPRLSGTRPGPSRSRRCSPNFEVTRTPRGTTPEPAANDATRAEVGPGRGHSKVWVSPQGSALDGDDGRTMKEVRPGVD